MLYNRDIINEKAMDKYVENVNENIVSEKIKNYDRNDKSIMELKFTLHHVDVSIANSIRRVILSEIPTLVFDSLDKEDINEENITIKKNNTILNNEIIKQRLSCIPIHIDNLNDFAYKNYRVVLDVENKEFERRIVTSEDFKIINIQDESYIDDDKTRSMFPRCSITKQFIDIVHLEPAVDDKHHDSIRLDCGMKIGRAKENGAYNVVSNCTYMYTKDEVKIEQEWNAIVEKLPADKEIREIRRRDFMNLDAERIYKHNSYDFTVQTVGVYSNHQIVRMACDIMVAKLKSFFRRITENVNLISENRVFMDNCYEILIEGEDFTLGKVLENVIYQEYFVTKPSKLSYISSYKDHPHEQYIKLRIAYNDNVEKNDILGDMKNVVEKCIFVYTQIKQTMKDTSA